MTHRTSVPAMTQSSHALIHSFRSVLSMFSYKIPIKLLHDSFFLSSPIRILRTILYLVGVLFSLSKWNISMCSTYKWVHPNDTKKKHNTRSTDDETANYLSLVVIPAPFSLPRGQKLNVHCLLDYVQCGDKSSRSRLQQIYVRRRKWGGNHSALPTRPTAYLTSVFLPCLWFGRGKSFLLNIFIFHRLNHSKTSL